MISICIRAIDDGDRKVPIVLCAPQLLHGERHSRWLGMGQVHFSIEKKTQVINVTLALGTGVTVLVCFSGEWKHSEVSPRRTHGGGEAGVTNETCLAFAPVCRRNSKIKKKNSRLPGNCHISNLYILS